MGGWILVIFLVRNLEDTGGLEVFCDILFFSILRIYFGSKIIVWLRFFSYYRRIGWERGILNRIFEIRKYGNFALDLLNGGIWRFVMIWRLVMIIRTLFSFVTKYRPYFVIIISIIIIAAIIGSDTI